MRKRDFPIFEKHRELIYLDSAATAQKPRSVIEAMEEFLARQNAPVHRSMYPLGERATALFEGVRLKVARFLGARDPHEIVFTRNTTEGINLLAHTWGRAHVRRGDVLLVSRMEHHSNFVPWLMFAKERGAELRIIELTADGYLDLRDFREKFSRRVKVVALPYVSNVLGTINPIARVGAFLREQRRASPLLFVVDAAQAAPHLPIDVARLGCDALAFSSHKLYGPTGASVLWARRAILDAMPPFLTGGHMILTVSDDDVRFNEVPAKFEAGTPDAAGVIGLGAAIDYLASIGFRRIIEHERRLAAYAFARWSDLPFRKYCTVYGPKKLRDRIGAIAFTVARVHPHDIATMLAEDGIAVRAGHHCAMPLHERLGVPATVRMSFGLYTDRRDLDAFFRSLKRRILPLAS